MNYERWCLYLIGTGWLLFGWQLLAREERVQKTLVSALNELVLNQEFQRPESIQEKVALVMDSMIERFGVQAKVDVASVMAENFSIEYTPLIFRRAMFYSSGGAAELIASSSLESRSAVKKAVLSTLPHSNLHTARLTSGGGEIAMWMTSELPDVELRRRGGGGPFYYSKESD